ncbi:hypothetical protein CSC2_32060 [Clostridium zeae]|uniref:TraB/GumN family protein n=1 Tax=Clostridium zeae TaxID=2759022 RepID=A0ABQ1ECZ8_9CLOT|nr:TraB/GumN family protein [Clostridium zeae]GFZ32680.1 hypothetical protein CSC2_32060 [Clostridium zeae]
MKKITKAFSLMISLVILTTTAYGCGQQVQQKPTEKLAKGIFYKVEKDGKYLYLGGTVHFAKISDNIKYNDKVENAYKEATKLGVEVDLTDPNLSKQRTTDQVYEGNQGLDDHITPEAKDHLIKVLNELGLKYDNKLKRYKLSYIATAIAPLQLSKLGYSFDKGIDMDFIQKAKKDKKDIVSLEDYDIQSKMDKFGDDAYNNYTISQIPLLDQSKKDAEGEYNAFIDGDISYLEKDVIDALKNSENKQTRDFYNLSIVERNDAMLKKVEGYIASDDKYFIVVGAAHIIGQDGLIEKLKAKGYTITRLE